MAPAVRVRFPLVAEGPWFSVLQRHPSESGVFYDLGAPWTSEVSEADACLVALQAQFPARDFVRLGPVFELWFARCVGCGRWVEDQLRALPSWSEVATLVRLIEDDLEPVDRAWVIDSDRRLLWCRGCFEGGDQA